MAGTGDPTRRVHSGERLRIQAASWNALIDMLRAFQAGAFGGGAPAQLRPLGPGEIWLRNDSGEDRERFDILGWSSTDAVFSTSTQLLQFQAWPLIAGGVPGDFLPFAVLREPAAEGEIGRAMVSGVTAVQVDIKDKGHRYAVPATDGSGGVAYEHLRSADCGHELLTRPAATGVQWCYVRMGAMTDEFWAKITSRTEHTSGGPHDYGFAEVYKAGGAYDWTQLSGGWSGTAYNSIEELTGRTRGHHVNWPEVGEVVKMRPRFAPDGTLEYWFQYEPDSWNDCYYCPYC